MQQDGRDIIIEVFSIIDFQDKREAYADRFIQNCQKQALVDLISILPDDKKDAFKQKMVGAKDENRQKAVIAQYFTAEQYKLALQKASQTAFTNFIQSIIPTLSNELKDKLYVYLETVIRQ